MGNQKGDGPDPLPPITLRLSLNPPGPCVTESAANGSRAIESVAFVNHLWSGGERPAKAVHPMAVHPMAVHPMALHPSA